MEKLKRSFSAQELINTNFKVMEFDGLFLDLFGKPEIKNCWLVYGGPASGKTNFVLQVCKYLARFERVIYDTLEEGKCESFKQACINQGMSECGSRVLLLDSEPIADLKKRLLRKRSPDIVVIDSVQYSRLTKIGVEQLLCAFPRKLFIFVSHAKGKEPKGEVATELYYKASVKIFVEGYQAKIESRYGGDKSKVYTIWQEGVEQYWGDL